MNGSGRAAVAIQGLSVAVGRLPPTGVESALHKQSMDSGLSETLEVDVGYASPMSSSQLQQAWLALLAKRHKSITSNEVDGQTRQIDVHGLGANVSIDLGDIGDCSRPYVAAQNN
jgi:hypothetical protein